jgi:hypothetical protein
MKKLFFLFAMLISVAASASVTVTPVRTDYNAEQVTFRVSWTGSAVNNRVWVWVDFCPVTGVTQGVFAPASITAVSATGGATSITARGFFVTANPATVTATLGNAPAGKFNWCAYGSDAPPNVTYNNVTYNGGTYTFKGTPPFKLVSADGSQTNEFNKKSVTVSEIGFVPKNFTDATGCPGLGFCPYTGNDEVMDATHFCHLRTSGAKNWETYIKDSRDNQIYRITQFSDNSWWFAEDLATTIKRYGVCNGVNFYNTQDKPNCPTGWNIPAYIQIWTRWPSGHKVTDNYGSEWMNVTDIFLGSSCFATNITCRTGPNFGIALVSNDCLSVNTYWQWEGWYWAWACMGEGGSCTNPLPIHQGGRVRCRRTL